MQTYEAIYFPAKQTIQNIGFIGLFLNLVFIETIMYLWVCAGNMLDFIGGLLCGGQEPQHYY